MKNSNRFKFGILMILFIGFQKLVAQPQFVIQDKVVFVTNNVIQDKVVFAAKPNQGQQSEGGVIQDTIVFSTSENSGSSSSTVSLDSIHRRLLALKRGHYDKANSFSWFNPHPTNSMKMEGYDIVILTPKTNNVLAEIRFVRQKTNVWVDAKFKNPANPAEIKTVVYSESNRKATVETFGGYKYSLSINANSGRIDIIPVKAQFQEQPVLSIVEIRIYKTAKLY